MSQMLQSARPILRAMQSFVPKQKGGVHILGYHLVDGCTNFPVDITETLFRSHLKSLSEKYEICSLQRAVQLLEQRTELNRTAVVLTFDDAYENFYSRVFPIISEYKIPVILYVPIDFVDGKSAAPLQGCQSLYPCSWKQLQEMVKGGLVSIGSHTFSHPDLRSVELSVARREIAESRKRLEDQLGTDVSSFAYPKALSSAEIERIVSESYASAVSRGGIKMQPAAWNRYKLTRIPILRNTPADLSLAIESSFWLEERLACWLHR